MIELILRPGNVFFSDRNNAPCIDTVDFQCVAMWEIFNAFPLQQNMDPYLNMDVILLADIFE